MYRMHILRPGFITLVISILFSISAAWPAFGQCSALCMHERVDASASTSGSFFGQAYEVALDYSDSAEADAVSENLILAADDADVRGTVKTLSSMISF